MDLESFLIGATIGATLAAGGVAAYAYAIYKRLDTTSNSPEFLQLKKEYFAEMNNIGGKDIVVLNHGTLARIRTNNFSYE